MKGTKHWIKYKCSNYGLDGLCRARAWKSGCMFCKKRETKIKREVK